MSQKDIELKRKTIIRNDIKYYTNKQKDIIKRNDTIKKLERMYSIDIKPIKIINKDESRNNNNNKQIYNAFSTKEVNKNINKKSIRNLLLNCPSNISSKKNSIFSNNNSIISNTINNNSEYDENKNINIKKKDSLFKNDQLKQNFSFRKHASTTLDINELNFKDILQKDNINVIKEKNEKNKFKSNKNIFKRLRSDSISSRKNFNSLSTERTTYQLEHKKILKLNSLNYNKLVNNLQIPSLKNMSGKNVRDLKKGGTFKIDENNFMKKMDYRYKRYHTLKIKINILNC